MIFTYKEIKRMLSYCEEHDNKNVIVFEANCSIGNKKDVALQTAWWRDENCEKQDITDYEAW